MPSFFNIFRSKSVADATPQTRSTGAISQALDYGVSVSNDSALKNTTLYAGIRLISENIASLPKSIVEYDRAGNAKKRPDHRIYRLINGSPNPYTNSFTFWSCIVTWLKGWGNAYALIIRRGGVPVELHQIHPSFVSVKIVNGKKWYKVTIADPNFAYLSGVYSDDDMLHFMELTLDGVKGVNPIVYNASVLNKSLAMEAFSSEFFRKGGNLKAVMETDGNLSQVEFDNWMENFRKSAGNHETPLLEYGIKYKQLTVDPVAEQLINSEILSIQDICRLLNIPPHMVAELSHATFSNIEHQTIQFVQYSLRPIIKRIEVEIENKLFFDVEKDSFDVKFVLDGLLRGDTAARSAYYHNAILDGYMSRNEVRQLEGLEAVDDLDKFLYPTNENVVGEINNESNQASNE